MISAKIKGEEIATEFYNIPRNEFVVVAWDEAKKIMLRIAQQLNTMM